MVSKALYYLYQFILINFFKNIFKYLFTINAKLINIVLSEEK